ncbi:hypothetical protein FRACYDRAFT_252657 [Fragilariopsis cylindrus CCMP1102]|uniref:Uncharacterized protein n=1 Tax=Fragilariopsis cylindrus CCMP1102 TaxID=635003 RepID=A0A1E7ELT2_9STRA|nr:hypothetical protein FRACYDRAFT_252657 [Fragilariopsis cylindrus CCMP1102]|eukprot:OEU06844.1 hypothetical protein FRACYDRAFT_252657 [Fragilariopsis cylindrus CCMP1102]
MVTTKSSDINWSPCSLQDLVSISHQVVKVIAQRKSESTLESIQRLTKGIQTEFNSCTEAIKSIDDVNIDVDQRWTLAIGFSNLICSMIHVADGMYGKLVNGSAGKFCPDTVWLLEDTLWKDLVKSTLECGTRPSEDELYDVVSCQRFDVSMVVLRMSESQITVMVLQWVIQYIIIFLNQLVATATATTVATSTTIKHTYFAWKDRIIWDHALWEAGANRSSDRTIDNA